MDTFDKAFRPLFLLTFFFVFHPIEKRGKLIKENQQCTIEMADGTTLRTDKNLRLIGETKGYIFIYDKSDSATTVVSRDKISRMKYKD